MYDIFHQLTAQRSEEWLEEAHRQSSALMAMRSFVAVFLDRLIQQPALMKPIVLLACNALYVHEEIMW